MLHNILNVVNIVGNSSGKRERTILLNKKIEKERSLEQRIYFFYNFSRTFKMKLNDLFNKNALRLSLIVVPFFTTIIFSWYLFFNPCHNVMSMKDHYALKRSQYLKSWTQVKKLNESGSDLIHRLWEEDEKMLKEMENRSQHGIPLLQQHLLEMGPPVIWLSSYMHGQSISLQLVQSQRTSWQFLLKWIYPVSIVSSQR